MIVRNDMQETSMPEHATCHVSHIVPKGKNAVCVDKLAYFVLG